MQRKRLKDSKDAGKYRTELLKEQKGLDPIIKKPVKDAVLDHKHFGDQECRAVLERTINSFEGKVFNSFQRYVKHLTDDNISTVLRSLADYYERDTSHMPIHHTALTVDVKRFKALPAKQQIEILEGLGLVAESNVKKRSNQARKLIKEGKLDMQLIKRN